MIAPCFVSMVDGVVPTLASFSFRPCGLVRECSPLRVDRGHHYLIVKHNIKNGDPNIGLFSRPRLAVDEQEHGLPLGDHLYLASFILIFAASPRMLAMIHICDPSAVPSFQMGDGSVVILFVLIVLFVLSLEYLGVRRPV